MNELHKPQRVLIADDTLRNIQVLGTLLRDKGYQLNVAQNGVRALKSVQTVPPDLILLDVPMPEMDGFETCRRLKASAATRDIAVDRTYFRCCDALCRHQELPQDEA